MLKARTTADLIADALAQDIAAGRIALGAPLRQEELAERFGVSRIPVRDALQRLEGDGIVVIYPNRGAFVATLSVDEIREIIDMRVLVEGDLIARAVPEMAQDDLERIEIAAAIAERESSARGWSEADHNFHKALYAPARRPRQLELALSLRRSIERYAAAHQRLPERRADWLEDHAALVDACRAGDTQRARDILCGHIERAGAFLIERVASAT